MTKPIHSFGHPPLFSPEEAELLGEYYQKAEFILEYGAGASTLLAQDLGRNAVAVEGDPDWAAKIQELLDGSDTIRIHTVNIGKTKKWGYPQTDAAWFNYPDYASTVWDRLKASPDVILVDGRFRLACFAVSLLRIRQRTVILFDDYTHRPHYHQIEHIVQPMQSVGKMAVFHVEPQNWPADNITQILRWFGDPR